MRHRPASPNVRPRARLPLWLCLALLWAQGLGLLHRVAHAPLPRAAPGAAATIETHTVSRVAFESQVVADALTGHEHDTPACRLYDQASAADAVAAAASTACAAPPAPGPTMFGAPAAPTAVVVHALPRGPPRT